METDGLLNTVTRVHCAVAIEIDTDEILDFKPDEIGEFLKLYTAEALLLGELEEPRIGKGGVCKGRTRGTVCALVTGFQTCALPIYNITIDEVRRLLAYMEAHSGQ